MRLCCASAIVMIVYVATVVRVCILCRCLDSIVLCLTFKSLQSGHPSYLYSYSSNRPTRPSSLITLNCHLALYSLNLIITDRSVYHFAPVLWNSLPPDLRDLSLHFSSFTSGLHSSPSDLSTSLFLKKLLTHLFHISFPP